MKRGFCLLLAVMVVFVCFPVNYVFADSPPSLDIGSGNIVINTMDSTYSVGEDEPIDYSTGDTITISGNGSSTTNSITVNGDEYVSITLQDVNIDVSNDKRCAFNITGSAIVNLTISGTNYLKSADNYAGLEVIHDAALTITGGSSDSLEATGGNNGAGIGGGKGIAGGNIFINGGNVQVTGGDEGGAGIGGGQGGNGGKIVINEGNVTIEKSGGAGIGGGSDKNYDSESDHSGGTGGDITINGGNVHVSDSDGAGIGGGFGDTEGGSGGNITINGGTVTVGTTSGTGIGGGNGKNGGSGGTIIINDGIITEEPGNDNGAGIGGGYGYGSDNNEGNCGDGGSITINDGIITITTIGGAGIGGGGGDFFGLGGGSGGDITISGGTIEANSERGAGIGAGSGSIGGSGGKITISGGTIEANSGNGAGIGGGGSVYGPPNGDLVGPGGSGGNITISGGTIEANSGNGAGIGGGYGTNGGSGGVVKISGGSVVATSKKGQNVGYGFNGNDSGSLTDGGGSNLVYPTTLNVVSASTAVTSLSFTQGPASYGYADMQTDIGGKLYLYLPAGDITGTITLKDGTAYGFSGNNQTNSNLTVTPLVTLQNAAANGLADITTSTGIDLTFDKAITGLTADDITITNGTGAAVKGALAGSGTSWSIALTSVTKQGNVSVTVTLPGYTISGSPKTVAVYKTKPVATVTSVTVTPAAPTVQKGNTESFSAAVAGTNDPAQTVSWSVLGNTSPNTNISSSGLLTIASDETASTLTVKATSTTDNTKSGSASVAVQDVPTGGGVGGSPTPVTPPAYPKTETNIQNGSITVTTTTTATVDNSGKAAAAVTQTQVSDAVSKAAEETAKQNGAKSVVKISVETDLTAKTVELSLPKTAVTAVADGNTAGMTVSTSVADITFDDRAMDTIAGQATDDVRITAAKADTGTLSQETKQVVGDRPVFNFSVTSGGKPISQFGGNVFVSVPYTPKAGEDTNAIVIYYINSQGKPEMVSDCTYDAATGTVKFSTSHFSQYAVGYNKVSFTDVAADAWYYKAVGFTAAREITSGTGNGKYSPEAKLTRGECIVMIMKAYGIAPDVNPSDNFSDSGHTYYTGYLAAAKRLGISAGAGSNMFIPGKEITRQEMFTLLYNTLKAIGKLPQGNAGKSLAAYNDVNQISTWAKDAMTLFAKTGTISGSNGRLTPSGTTTRAQMAQVLYNLLSKL